MITVTAYDKNDNQITNLKATCTKFPDNTKLLNVEPIIDAKYVISWLYDNDSELFTVISLAKHLKQNGIKTYLNMPYIPNARMDRVKDNSEVFTLKYFADVINWLDFERVYVANPHSTVSEALFNKIVFDFECVKEDIMKIIYGANCVTQFKPDILFFPDSGALKRYNDLLNGLDIPFAYGEKNRDWKTGKILGLNVISNGIDLNGKKILIVDDISSKGGTFFHSANALKKLGASDIALYVTHCENTILEGELVKETSPIERIYTTNSILRVENDRIEVVRNF